MTRTIAEPAPAASPLGTFERFLSLWVLAAILTGLALGMVAPSVVGVMAGLESDPGHGGIRRTANCARR